MLAPSQSAGLFASAAEKRSFEYFQQHASKCLGGMFNQTFWGREVLQAAIHNRPIRHLVIGLGATYEAFESGTSAASQAASKFSLQQCNSAIRLLANLSPQSPATQSPETVSSILTASILFIYLATLRGNMAESIQHVRSSIKLLQDVEASHSLSKTPFPIPLSQLRRLLISSYTQLRGMINDTALEAIDHDSLFTPLEPATIFLSIPDAHAYVERLSHNTLAFHQSVELRPPTTDARLEEIVARHGVLCRALLSSQNALDELSASLNQTPEDKGITLLRLHQTLITTRLRLDVVLHPEQREIAFDDLESLLEEMLEYCEILCKSEGPRKPTCSSGLGIITPLHTIAARCRNPRIRRRAVRLLLESQRKECLWDSTLTGKVAMQTMEIEEAEWQGERIGNEKRVWEVKIELQGERRALLRFVRAGDRRTEGTVHRVISW